MTQSLGHQNLWLKFRVWHHPSNKFSLKLEDFKLDQLLLRDRSKFWYSKFTSLPSLMAQWVGLLLLHERGLQFKPSCLYRIMCNLSKSRARHHPNLHQSFPKILLTLGSMYNRKTSKSVIVIQAKIIRKGVLVFILQNRPSHNLL